MEGVRSAANHRRSVLASSRDTRPARMMGGIAQGRSGMGECSAVPRGRHPWSSAGRDSANRNACYRRRMLAARCSIHALADI